MSLTARLYVTRPDALPVELVTRTLADAGLSLHAGAPLALVVGTGSPDDTDELLRDSVPHLHVSGGPDHVQVGPFVAPGITACLRCVAAGGGLAALPAGSAPDPALLTAGLALGVRDLARWASGRLPATWSKTLRVHGDLDLRARAWPRHPHCGCAWGEAV